MYPLPPLRIIGDVLAKTMVILYPVALFVRTRDVVVPYDVPPVRPSSVPTIVTGDVLAINDMAPDIVCVTVNISVELRLTTGSSVKYEAIMTSATISVAVNDPFAVFAKYV
jgi:hypothetical protein